MGMLRLEHLNAEEWSHVESLIERNSDCFYLSDEKLEYECFGTSNSHNKWNSYTRDNTSFL